MKTTQSNHIAVISGGTGYLGSAIALALAEKGARVALLCRASSDAVKVSDTIASLPGKGHCAYECDFFSKESVTKAISSIEKDMGPITSCVHAAGEKPKRKAILSIDDHDLDEALIKNIVPAHNFITACAQSMKLHAHGVIVGITTAGVAIPEATRGLGAYTLAKYALQGELSALKEEMKGFGVRVYSVAPGFMEGGMNADVPKAFVEMMRKKSRTITSREDVADVVARLATGEASDDTFTHVVAGEYNQA